MLEAQRRFEWLVQRGDPGVIEATIEHARTLYLQDQADPSLAAQFRASAAALTEDGTIAGDARRAWAMLRRRVGDERVSARLAEISKQLVLGATSGGEVSAATLAFPDGSYLMLTDHGLVNLTWLAAQLFVVSRRTSLMGFPPPEDPVDLTAAAQALRLAVSRISAGGRAGINPSLVLVKEELALAGALVSEIDVFVFAHEAAHILLEHFRDDRTTLGVVGGANRLLGRRPHEEEAADLLAIMLQFDDLLSAGEGDDHTVGLRLTAVRLFLAVLELYERSMFVVQPTSHPPAAERWRVLVAQRLSRWFDDVDGLLPGALEWVAALRELETTSRLRDASAANRGLGARLDRKLWSFYDWSQAAVLGRYLLPVPTEALEALLHWPGWTEGTDVEAEVACVVGAVLSTEAGREILRAAASGTEVVSRLAAAKALAGEADSARRGAPEPEEPFPSWAIAGIALDAIAAALADDA